jgi:hypothetical protein
MHGQVTVFIEFLPEFAMTNMEVRFWPLADLTVDPLSAG